MMLKQFDIDGKHFSKQITVVMWWVRLNMVRVFPNPSSERAVQIVPVFFTKSTAIHSLGHGLQTRLTQTSTIRGAGDMTMSFMVE